MPTDNCEIIRKERSYLAELIRKYKYEFPLERNVAKYLGTGIIGNAGEWYYFDYGWKGYKKIITISKEEFDNLNIGDYCSPTKDFPYHVAISGYSTNPHPNTNVQLILHLS